MLIPAMQEFLERLLTYPIDGKTSITLQKGRRADDVYSDGRMIVIIESGTLEVRSRSGGLVNILHEGDAFGISNLFCDDNLETRLIARCICRLTLLPKSAVKALMDAHVCLYHAYCATVNRKLAFLLSRVSLLSIKSNRKRVAAFLLGDESLSFSSREEMASYLCLGKSALFRELRFLSDCGAVEWNNHEIRVLDRSRLEEVLDA